MHRGKEWSYAFLMTDSRLSEQARMDILHAIADLYVDREKRKNIKGDGFEGRVSTKGNRYTVGALRGQAFTANIETDHGKKNLVALVEERVPYENN